MWLCSFQAQCEQNAQPLVILPETLNIAAVPKSRKVNIKDVVVGGTDVLCSTHDFYLQAPTYKANMTMPNRSDAPVPCASPFFLANKHIGVMRQMQSCTTLMQRPWLLQSCLAAASVKRCKLTVPSIVLACDVEEGDELIVYMEK